MSEIFMPKDKAINWHLTKKEPSKGFEAFTGFVQGLRESRQATGRNLDDGEKIDSSKHGSWVGAMGYMALLDQVGKCFKPTNTPNVQGNTIFKALSYFSDLSKEEIDALYALRCAFMHDFSLYNIHDKKPSLTHAFGISSSSFGKVITLPVKPWNGDYQEKTSEHITDVNLELFGDLVEQVCGKIVTLHQAKTLEVTLPNETDELLQRYSFYLRYDIKESE